MTTTWDRIDATTYATPDWRIVVEKVASTWTVSELGTVKHTARSAGAAKSWAEKWMAGEVIVAGNTPRSEW